jgi:Domain of unknown function (DUF1413)
MTALQLALWTKWGRLIAERSHNLEVGFEFKLKDLFQHPHGNEWGNTIRDSQRQILGQAFKFAVLHDPFQGTHLHVEALGIGDGRVNVDRYRRV